MSQLVVIAFGFGNLAMLGWLAAAAAPLLIHLWSRHRFREAPWAAMQFLLAAMRKNARRLQLQQWLLLAVRTLIIVLVVLAVAEPYGEQLLAGGGAEPAHRILVIDGSYSMAYRANGKTNFARARQLALELVQSSGAGDVFSVILMSASAKIVVGPELLDRAAIERQIESLAQTHGRADLPGTLAMIENEIADDRNRRLPPHKEVVFFTDLQHRTWGQLISNGESTADKAQSGIADALAALSKRASFVVVDLGQAGASNLAVANLSADEPAVVSGREVGFTATLRNFGPQPLPQYGVEWLVDDVPVGEQRLDLAARGEASLRFTHRFQSLGQHTLTVRAKADRLELDNSRSTVINARREIRVLCVAGRESAARYIANALNPNPAGNSPIRPVVIAEGDLAETQLSDFDCVFLCNVAQLTANEAERLARYAEAGGGVVFFLGDRVAVSSYNAFADKSEPQDSRPPLLPARIGDLVSQSQFGLDPLGYQHPIVAPFRGREGAGLLTTPVRRYLKLDVARSRPGVEVAVTTSTGDPFIVTAPLGRGRVIVVATDGSLASVDPASGEPWTNWPTWPSFLPIVRELLAFAMGGQQEQSQQLVGTPLSGFFAVASSSDLDRGKLQIVRPDGRAAPVSVQTSPGGLEWRYADTDVSGIYSLRGLPGGETPSFAVNVDATEGDLAKVDPQQLPPALMVRPTSQRDTAAASVEAISQSGWSQSILWAVLVLMFAESLMAWQFGRGVI